MILEKPKNLFDLSSIYEYEIASQQYHFDRATVKVNKLKQVTKDQLIEFYNEVVDIASIDRRKLSIHVVSSAEGGAGNPNCFKELNKKGDDLPDVEYLPEVEDNSTVCKFHYFLYSNLKFCVMFAVDFRLLLLTIFCHSKLEDHCFHCCRRTIIFLAREQTQYKL